MNTETAIPVTPSDSTEPFVPAPTGRTACVVGAGFGGLALAIRLQSAGITTTVVEARDKPGGRAYYWERDGFTFDAGPTVITDPDCLKELWALTGHDIARDVELMPVMPFYRLAWPDGTQFDYSNDEEQLFREIAQLNPADVAGYQRFLEYSEAVYEEGYVKLGHVPFLDFKSMLKAAPALAKQQAWRSVYSMVSSYVENEKLREALSFHTLLVGGNPMKTSSIYALIHKLEKDGGVWWAKGGTNRLIAARQGLRQEPVAQELQPQPVRRPLRHRGKLAGYSASHDPVRSALQRPARGHLRSRRPARGFLDLSAPPQRQ